MITINKIAKIIMVLSVASAIWCSISFGDDSDTYSIKYTVKNNENSADEMKNVSLPKENIKIPDYVEILDISPSEPVNITKNASQDFKITFKLKKDVPKETTGIVTVKLNTDQEQCTTVTEEKIEIADLDPPIKKSSSIFPTTVRSDEPQSVCVVTSFTDDWSGVDLSQDVTIKVGNQTVPVQIYSTTNTNNEFKVEAKFISPTVEGKYEVELSGIKDKANNRTQTMKLGTLTVQAPRKKDPPIPMKASTV